MSCRQLQENQRGLEGLFWIVVDLLEEEPGWRGGMHHESLKARGLLGETDYQALAIVRNADAEGI